MGFHHWWLINHVRPNGLLIQGDHLFLNYKKIGQWWLINREGFINPTLTWYGKIKNMFHTTNQIWAYMILYGFIIPHPEEMIADFLPVQLIRWILGLEKYPPPTSHRALMAAIFSLSFLFFSSFASQSITQFRNNYPGVWTVPGTVWHNQKE